MKEKKRNPFKLKEFRNIDPEVIAMLELQGIKTSGQMLAACGSREQRKTLAQKTCLPEEKLGELVRLSDLSRLPGVKGIRARLYYDAGIDSVEKMAACEPTALLAKMQVFVEQTGFDGIAPLPKEVRSTIANAMNLPRIVEF